ncbi:MAG: hypothetical protein ABJI33_12325 [Balneola sp.]
MNSSCFSKELGIGELRIDSFSELRTQNSELRTQNSELRTQNSIYIEPNS